MSRFSRNQVRDFLEECQMNHPTEDQVALLHGYLVRELIEYGGMSDTLRMQFDKQVLRKSLRCESFYFKNRQAVTFEPDGFVGIAGWADDTNLQPFCRGIIKWAEAVSGAKYG